MVGADKMATVTVVAKKWGNSIGVIIPKDIVEAVGIKPEQSLNIEVKQMKNSLAELFGKFKTDKPTQQIKNELKKELWGKEL